MCWKFWSIVGLTLTEKLDSLECVYIDVVRVAHTSDKEALYSTLDSRSSFSLFAVASLSTTVVCWNFSVYDLSLYGKTF